MIFDTVGFKYIYVYVTELDTTVEHFRECWWEVYDYFEYYGFYLWIEQDYDAYINEEIYMGLHYESNFNVSRNVSFELIVNGGSYVDYTIYFEYQSIAAYEQGMIDTFHTFTEAGYYDITFIIYDFAGDYTYVSTCYWYIYEGSSYLPFLLQKRFSVWINYFWYVWYLFNFNDSGINIEVNN